MVKKQLTEVEVEKLQQLQQKTNAVIQELGQISLTKLNLKARYKAAQEYLETVNQERDVLAKELQDKYGEGSFDLNTKEFIPTQN